MAHIKKQYRAKAERPPRLFTIIAALAVVFALMPGAVASATVSNITRSQYDARNCSPDQTALYYRNQFGMCFDNFWSSVNTSNPYSSCNMDGVSPQVAVGTTPGSTDIMNWTAFSCNSTFNPTFSVNMNPGSTYYVSVKGNAGGNHSYVYTTGPAVLENQAPTISSLVPASAWHRSAPGSTLNLSFADNGGSYPNGRLRTCEYTTFTQAGQTGTNSIPWTPVFSNLNASTYSALGSWTINWNALPEGDNFVSFRCTDYAGNSANFFDQFNIRKDTAAPTHTIVALPAYVTSGLTQQIRWSASDATSGIGCFTLQYKDTTAAGSWTNAMSPTCQIPAGSVAPNDYKFDFTGIEGHRYEFRIQAQDNAGNTDSFDADNTFFTTFDTVKPTSAITNPPMYVNTASFAVSWSGNDGAAGSGIAGFNAQYKPGAAGTWTDWRVGSPGTTNTTENFNIGTDGTQYFFRVQAQDNAGNVETAYSASSSGVLLDTTLPTSAVNALTTYTTAATFNVTWTGSDTSAGTASGINCYDAEYNKNNTGWTTWQSCNTGVSASFTSTGNGTYAFRSRAKDNAGNWENWPATADTQTIVDTTPPTFTAVNDGPGADAAYSASASTIEANWSAADTDTGIDHYEYAIGTTSGGTNILGWTNNGTATSFSSSGLSLVHGTVYYVTIRAYNPAGLFTDQPSNGIKIDIAAPTTSMSAPNSPYMGSTDFTVAWSGADGAGESGLTTYTVQYKTVGLSAWSNWKTDTTLTSDIFTGINGYKYQFRTIAKDAVGNTTPLPTSPDYQVETTVDTSNLPAPSNIAEGSETDPDADYTSNTTSLSAHWDAVSGAASYYYSAGTAPGASDTISWTETTSTSFTKTGLALADGATYYISLKAKNFSGGVGFTGGGDGLTVDLTAPGCGVTPLATFQGTAQFSVQWSAPRPRRLGH